MVYRHRAAAGKLTRQSSLSPEAPRVARVSVKLREGTEEDRVPYTEVLSFPAQLGLPSGS